MGERICSIEDCGKPVQARGWCAMHYTRWRQHGDSNYTMRPTWGQPEEVRFFAKVDAEGDCWLWTASRSPDGYAIWSNHGVRAHLWLWRHLVGPVPDDMELDHRCRVRHCVNPDHLEPVPKRVNWIRGHNPMAINARKTHCPQGHPYAGENLRIYTRPNGQTSRYCRTCQKEPRRGAKVALANRMR